MRTLKWRPSPALLVAALAISIALVGTAAAGPIDNPIAQDSRLTKKDRQLTAKIARQLSLRFIKRFTPILSNRQITQRAPGLSVANAENAENAEDATNAENAVDATNAENANDANALDGKSINDVVMWAFVNNDGSLKRSSGGATSSQQGAGDYDVTFPRDVDTCAYNATSAADDNIGPATNEIAVALTGPAAITDTVTVRTGASADGTPANDEFMIQVTC